MNTHRFTAAFLFSTMIGYGSLGFQCTGSQVNAAELPGSSTVLYQRHTPAPVMPLAEARVRIRVQGKLAMLAIREEAMAEFRRNAGRQLSLSHYRVDHFVAAAGGSDPESETLKKAQALFKSVKFEWPEFMPRGLQ